MNEINKYFDFIFTNDGSTGLYNYEVDDIYHSSYGAKNEALEKFVKPLNFTKNFSHKNELKVLDICYGIGYNTKTLISEILKNKYSGKVYVDLLEYDKNLVLISPFIKDNYFKKSPEISCIINFNLINEIYNGKECILPIIMSNENKKFIEPFYRRLINKYKKFGYKYDPTRTNNAFLHNIYYTNIMNRYKIGSRTMYSMKFVKRFRFHYISKSLYY